MKLVISRRQADVKGLLGGHKGVNFTLSYRLVLTDEEQKLVSRYKLEQYPLTWKTMRDARLPDDTIANMTEGRAKTVGDVTTLVRDENIIKDACDSLPILFDVVRTFGGNEEIAYPRNA